MVSGCNTMVDNVLYATSGATAGVHLLGCEFNTVSLGQNGQLIHVVATGAGGSTRSRTVALKVLPFVVPSQRVTLVGHLVSKAQPGGVSGAVPLTVRIYTQRKGGTPLYTEHFREEAMRPIASEGRFSVQLGTGDASETLVNLTKTRETLYAEIRFGAGTVQELAPERIPFTAIPYTKGVAP